MFASRAAAAAAAEVISMDEHLWLLMLQTFGATVMDAAFLLSSSARKALAKKFQSCRIRDHIEFMIGIL